MVSSCLGYNCSRYYKYNGYLGYISLTVKGIQQWLHKANVSKNFITLTSACNYASSRPTLYNVILSIARNFLETRENTKISTHFFYHFHRNEAKKIKMADSKELRFSKLPILKIFQIGPWVSSSMMLRALMWLNIYGCEAVRHKL